MNTIKMQKKTLGEIIATNMTALKILSSSKNYVKSKRKTIRSSQKSQKTQKKVYRMGNTNG